MLAHPPPPPSSAAVTTLSPSIGHLAALQILIVKSNALTALPDLTLLRDLRVLDASFNALEALPAGINPRLELLEVCC